MADCHRLGLLSLPPALILHHILIHRARKKVGKAHRQVLKAIDDQADSASDGFSDFQEGSASADASYYRTARNTADALLSTAERALLRARKRVRILRWEQRAMLADACFILYEALRPDKEKQVLEGLSGTISSLIRIGTLCSS